MKGVITCCGSSDDGSNAEKEVNFQDKFVVPNANRTNGARQPSTTIGTPVETPPLTWKFWQKRRYIVVMLAFFGFFNVYTMRVNLSVGIVAMTELRPVTYPNGTVGHEQYFNWSSTEQGLILSAFFYGYILTQLIGGYFGAKVGGNWVFGIGIFTTAILTLLTPLAAKSGVYVLIAVRVIEGIFEGVTLPCVHDIWSRWAPPHERSRMATIALAGTYVGTVIAMPLSGILAKSVGWESLFYVFGVVGVIWFIFWVIVVRRNPEQDQHITKEELQYIKASIGPVRDEKPSVPWKAILTSKHVYAIYVANTAETWGLYTLITQLPTFLKDAMNYDLHNAGFLSATPYLALAILLFVFGYLADWVQMKKYLTTTQVRRYFNCLGFLLQGIFMLLAAYLLHPVWSIVCIILAVGFGALVFCGYCVNALDIAPQFASIIMGISNTFGTIPGIISPTLTGVLVKNKTMEEWRIVFFITSGVYAVGCIVYWIWCTSELQPWAKRKEVVVDKESNTDTANI